MRAPAQSLRSRFSELFAFRRDAAASHLKERRREVEEHAVQVFGDERTARTWLSRPNRALDREVPRKLMKSADGIERVDVILGRIEHGIIS
jgi:putative toxin-antitoxin system antitoxin component (TIGR02293 family)